MKIEKFIRDKNFSLHSQILIQYTAHKNYESRTESHEQLFFASKLGTADEGEYGGRWNQLLCYS